MTLARLITAIALGLVACSERWEGFVYPSKSDLSRHITIGIYESLEECRASAIKTLNTVSSVDRGDYECGLNCRSEGSLPGIKVCKETAR